MTTETQVLFWFQNTTICLSENGDLLPFPALFPPHLFFHFFMGMAESKSVGWALSQ